MRAFGLADLTYLYNVEWIHARHVQHLAVALFDQLRVLHGLGAADRAVLTSAALRHDAGVVIDFYNHDRPDAAP